MIRIPASRAAAISASPDLVRVGVRPAARAVVQVVELADGGDPRPAPSRRRSPGRGASSSRGSRRRRDRVHRPRARSRSCRRPRWARPRSARWKAWEWALAKPGKGEPVEPLAPGGRLGRPPARPRRSARPRPRPPPRPRPLAAEPGELAPVRPGRRHDPTRSTNSAIRSTNPSRWKRSNCSQVVSVRGSATRSRNRIPSRWSTSCWKVPAVSPRLTSSCATPSRSR